MKVTHHRPLVVTTGTPANSPPETRSHITRERVTHREERVTHKERRGEGHPQGRIKKEAVTVTMKVTLFKCNSLYELC